MSIILIDTEGANWGYNTAWLFFATGIVLCVLIWFYVSESSRRNHAEMDEMYKGHPRQENERLCDGSAGDPGGSLG